MKTTKILRQEAMEDLNFMELMIGKAVSKIQAISQSDAETIREDLPEAYRQLCVGLELKTAILAELDILDSVEGHMI